MRDLRKMSKRKCATKVKSLAILKEEKRDILEKKT